MTEIEKVPIKNTFQYMKMFIIGIFIIAIAIKLSLYLIDSRRSAAMQSMTSQLQQYMLFKEIKQQSFKKTHLGGVVIIDSVNECFSNPYNIEMKKIDRNTMYAYVPSEVKTIVFLTHSYKQLAKYSGGISISGAGSDDPLFLLYKDSGNSIEVVKEDVNLKIIDIETRSLIAYTTIEGPSPQFLPRQVGIFMKQGDNSYLLGMTEGKTSEIAWHVVFCKKKPCGVAIQPGIGSTSYFDDKIHNWIASYFSRK